MPKMVPAGTDTLMWSTATVSPNRFTSSDTTSTTSLAEISFGDVAGEGERISPTIGAEGTTSLEATGRWVDRLGAGEGAGSVGAVVGGAGARTEVDRGIVDRGIVDLGIVDLGGMVAGGMVAGGVVVGVVVTDAAPGRAVSTSGIAGAAAKAGGGVGAGVGRFTGARGVVVLGVTERGVEARVAAGLAAAGFAAAGFAAAGFAAAGFAVAGFAVAGFAVAGFAVADFDAEGRGAVVRGAVVREAGAREFDGLRAFGADTGGVVGVSESSPEVGAAAAPFGFSSGSESTR